MMIDDDKYGDGEHMMVVTMMLVKMIMMVGMMVLGGTLMSISQMTMEAQTGSRVWEA